jgi:hypothetical protein
MEIQQAAQELDEPRDILESNVPAGPIAWLPDIGQKWPTVEDCRHV